MIKVIIVDDSPTARVILTEVLNSDPEIEVVGSASDGREGVALTKHLEPDLVMMDIHMPVMDGFEATKDIMIDSPRPVIIVSSSTSVHEVETGMKALKAGAVTLMLKPPSPKATEFEMVCREIIESVKAMSEVKVIRHRRKGNSTTCPAPHAKELPGLPSNPKGLRAIAIVASTGGPPALNQLLNSLPSDFPVPLLVVQHIAHGFVDGFARWLDMVVPMRVKLAEQDEVALPGTAYVAPQDVHLRIGVSGRLELTNGPAVEGFRPAGSELLQSAAVFGRGTVGIILTGMGCDGVTGMQKIFQAGGWTIAQDQDSCVVFGMPRVAIEAGAIREVLPIEQIGDRLLQLIQRRETVDL